MKSYINGFLTGGFLFFSLLIFSGAKDKNFNKHSFKRYELQIDSLDQHILFDTVSGSIYKIGDRKDSRGASNWEEVIGFIEY